MEPISARLRRISRRSAALAAVTVAGVALAACGSSGGGSSSSTGTSSSASASSGSSGKPLNLAYLSFAVENSYDAPMLAAAQAVASDNHATMKVFDANNSPQTQYAQLQDVISSRCRLWSPRCARERAAAASTRLPSCLTVAW